METSLGHSPAGLFKFKVSRITFLGMTRESIENLCISLMLPRFSNALKRIMRLECYLSLWSLEDLVP